MLKRFAYNEFCDLSRVVIKLFNFELYRDYEYITKNLDA